MSNAFPESYDELAVLAHYGATEAELARRLAERERMSQQERFHVDLLARSHQGPTLAAHRARWAAEDGEPTYALPASAYPPDAVPPDPVPGVPAGTASDVLDWVGADTRRARAALDAEQARARPRISLTETLVKIADGAGG